MNNSLDKQYLDIANEIYFHKGKAKTTRNATTLSVFGRQIRHDMSTGFPIYTTKKMSLKTVFTELKWFLLGRTDLKYLVDRKCYIWVGDAYKRYKTKIQIEFDWIKEYNEDNFIFVDGDTEKSLNQLNGGLTHIASEKEFIELIKNDAEFSDLWGDLGEIYGKQWRGFSDGDVSIDQIKQVITMLKEDRNSRRILMSAWNPPKLNRMILPPCHMFFQCYTAPINHDEKLEIAERKGVSHGDIKDFGLSLLFYCRSQDFFLGTPYNTVSYGIILTILSVINDYEPMELIHVMGDTHLYIEHEEAIKSQLNNKGHKLPRLKLKGLLDGKSHQQYWNGDDFDIDSFIENMEFDDVFELVNYQHDGEIKAPLIN